METPEAWPPVVLAQTPDGLFLIDGFHRHDAAIRLGLSELVASIFDPPQDADLFGIAFQLNVKHGRPLTLRDRKGYALTLLARYPDLADREIGRRCGLHHDTVGALRGERYRVRIAQRKSGELPGDVGPFDPIRYRKKATREQKAVAGYVARLAIALGDPYEENSALESWPKDPAEIAQACILTMGRKRATETLQNIAADVGFMIKVVRAAHALLQEAS